MTEHTCALRALTLCDGHEAEALSPRARVTRCWCAMLEVLGDELLSEEASQYRTERARAVARSAELERRREWRLRSEDW